MACLPRHLYHPPLAARQVEGKVGELPHGTSQHFPRSPREQTPTPYKGKTTPPPGVTLSARGTSAARNIRECITRDDTEKAPRVASYGPTAARAPLLSRYFGAL